LPNTVLHGIRVGSWNTKPTHVERHVLEGKRAVREQLADIAHRNDEPAGGSVAGARGFG
jgi:hypothetical protein